MPIAVELVELANIPLHPHLEEILESGQRKHFMPYDAQRISYAFNKAQAGKTCLEVGPGSCDLATMLHRASRYDSMIAIDIMDRRNRLPSAVDFHIMNVGDLEFEDNSFDSVFCMEVLEHLDDATFAAGLSELRRVCRGQLLLTVPFLEPMPSKHHLQQFTETRVKELFPTARVSLLLKEPVMRVPWLMIEEECKR